MPSAQCMLLTWVSSSDYISSVPYSMFSIPLFHSNVSKLGTTLPLMCTSTVMFHFYIIKRSWLWWLSSNINCVLELSIYNIITIFSFLRKMSHIELNLNLREKRGMFKVVTEKMMKFLGVHRRRLSWGSFPETSGFREWTAFISLLSSHLCNVFLKKHEKFS